jgi:hypothetical protein
MKLKIYNTTNSKISVTGKATIRVNERAGLLTFSKAAAELIGIMEIGSSIEICQDEDSPEDFFVYKSATPEAFSLRIKGTNAPTFNCTKLATLLLDKGQEKKHTIPQKRAESFMIGSPQEIDGQTMHLIILSKPPKA